MGVRRGNRNLRRRAALQEGFQAALQHAPLQQYTVLALLALEADIGAQPDHPPLESAAGVRLAQADQVADAELDDRHAAATPISRSVPTVALLPSRSPRGRV